MATIPGTFTFSVGSVLTAAQLNTYLSNAVAFFLSVPVFEGRQTVAQSLTTAVQAGLTLDVEDIDNDNGHSTVTNTDRYTAQTAGRWRLGGGAGYAANATGRRGAIWGINGAAINAGQALGPPTAANTCMVTARSMTVFLNVGDYTQIRGFQESGGNLNTAVSGGEQPNMSMRWEGTT